MMVLGLDPGYEQSAGVLFNGHSVTSHWTVPNELLIHELKAMREPGDAVLVVEQISMGGMIAGAETFETCFWSGRFVQAWRGRWDRLKRKDVKLHLCGHVRATDANIRQSLVDRFGPSTEKAIGRKKEPGPLFGITKHEWAALAVAVTWYDQKGHLPEELRPGVRAEF